MAKKPRKFTVKDYYSEPMIIGGLPTTRGEFIREMQAGGHDQRRIDMFLFGYERGNQIRAAKQQREWESKIKEQSDL